MRFLKDQRGSSFLENALWIILFVLTIAPFVLSLATTTGSKFENMAGRIGEVSYFQVVNDVPFTYNWGAYSETVTRPGVVGIIRVPVALGLFARAAPGAPGNLVLTVHSTVGPEVISTK